MRTSGFNPRTREGCDVRIDDCGCHFEFQSTHPRRVRRTKSYGMVIVDSVSIHAPAKGATRSRQICHVRRSCFNPRTREGCDKMSDALTEDMLVSIHAPAKGATINRVGSPCMSFQSTHPRRVRPHYSDAWRHGVSIHAPAKGATQSKILATSMICKFQSTHPRRVRHVIHGLNHLRSLFQSTHPRRVRPGRDARERTR